MTFGVDGKYTNGIDYIGHSTTPAGGTRERERDIRLLFLEAQGEEALRASGIYCGIVIILTQGGLSLGGIIIASFFCVVLGCFLDTGYV